MRLVPLHALNELKIVEPKAPKKTKPAHKKPESPEAKTRREAIKKQQSQQKAARTRERKARAARAEAAVVNKAKRQARKEKLRKDVEDKVREKAGRKPTLSQIPAQIAHCMMAVHVKRGKSKEAAWNICRWSLTKHGYLKGPYRKNTKLPKATKQTGKGSTRSFQHGMEKKPLNRGVPGSGTSKFKKFTKMFRDMEPDIVPKRAQ